MNRKYVYIGISVIVLIFGIVVIPEIMQRAANGDIVRNEHQNVGQSKAQNDPSATQITDPELAYVKVNEERKEIPQFSFTDQHGETITNADYKGQVYIAEFFYTTCPTICPKMNAQMAKIQDQFSEKEDFAIASFSINPSNDTPEVLKKYAKENGVTSPDWHLMTGDRDKIFKLANDGFNLYAGTNKNVDGHFQHSGYFALIDREGYVRSRRDKYGNPIVYYNALDKGDMMKLKADIKKLL